MMTAVTYEDFLVLPVQMQRAYLRHPVWAHRCLCREYGFPWDGRRSILAPGDIRHTEALCAPDREFIH